jgi:hypothetical protein
MLLLIQHYATIANDRVSLNEPRTIQTSYMYLSIYTYILIQV